MKERILVFLQNENKSYAQFAEEIGVQPSGISHILSGRNNPSLDFIVKMLLKYPSLSAEWLLFGRGTMYKFVAQPTLFDTEAQIDAEPKNGPDKAPLAFDGVISGSRATDLPEGSAGVLNSMDSVVMDEKQEERKLIKVLLFFSDKTFSEYRPG